MWENTEEIENTKYAANFEKVLDKNFEKFQTKTLKKRDQDKTQAQHQYKDMLIHYDCDEYRMMMTTIKMMIDNTRQSSSKAILDIKETEITHKRR